MSLTKRELRDIYDYLRRMSMHFTGLGKRPIERIEDLNRVNELVNRVALEAASMKQALEKGRLVLSWRVARELAPTLNSYAFMKTWQRERVRRQLDTQVRDIIVIHKQSPLNMAKKKRWVRATRFSTKVVDDSSIDVIGGKMPLDSLVRCEVLVDDSPEWCIRETKAEKTKPGNAHLLIEVFEVTTEGEEAPAPVDVDVDQDPFPIKPSPIMKHIKGER